MVRSFHDHEVRKERSAQKLEVCFKIKTRQKKKRVTFLSPRRDRLTHSLSLSGPRIRALHFWPARQHSPPQPLRHPRVRGRNKTNALVTSVKEGQKYDNSRDCPVDPPRIQRHLHLQSLWASKAKESNDEGKINDAWLTVVRPPPARHRRRRNVRAPTCRAVTDG